MKNIYEEVKTPYNYGILLSFSRVPREFDSDLVDNPNIFTIPHDKKYIYMTYVGHDGKGYRTGLARSKDFLSWEKLGKILENGEQGAWDEFNTAGYIVRDHIWGDVPTAHKTKDDLYAMTYLASDKPGYEAGIKRAGVAFTSEIVNNGEPVEWNKYKCPVLDAEDRKHPYENGIIWKLQAIYDSENKRYVGFYNASSEPEVMCQAYSKDLICWEREKDNPVVSKSMDQSGNVWGKTHNADGDVVRIGDKWVMFYFSSSPYGIIDTFAVSYDMKKWQKSFIPLTERNETYSSQFAHKPCVFKKNGVVYHYYNAVGNEGRVIALCTSVDLSIYKNAIAVTSDQCDAVSYSKLQYGVECVKNELVKDKGNKADILKALDILKSIYPI